MTARAVTVTVGAQTEIRHAAGDGYMAFPFAYGFMPSGGGAKRIVISWATNADGGASQNNWVLSTDGTGASFGATNTTPNLMATNMMQRSDASLIAIPFASTRVSASPSPAENHQFNFTYYLSAAGTTTGNPGTWTTHTNGLITFPSTISVNWVNFHRGVVRLSDGSWRAPAYAWFNTTATGGTNEPSWRSILLKSTNNGVSWDYVNTIAYTTTMYPGYNETTLAICKNGSMLAVIRRDDSSGSGAQPLVYRRSTNSGTNWLGTTAVLPGLTTANSTGVDPQLLLMPNGILALTWGKQLIPGTRRAPHIAFSADGNGTGWSNDTATYTVIQGQAESSGYTAVVPITNSRLLLIGDRGSNLSYGTPHPTPNPYAVWKKYIDVVP